MIIFTTNRTKINYNMAVINLKLGIRRTLSWNTFKWNLCFTIFD